jgi:hypothetical protein
LVTFGSALLSLALAFPGAGLANNDAPSRRSLVGLDAVRVEIPEVGDELRERGITEEVIHAEVQLQLRRAGIEMLDPERPRAKSVDGNPTLRVEVLANVHETYDQASFSVEVSVWQDVKLARHAKKKRGGPALRAPTWSTGGIGESGTDWRDVLRDELAFYVSQFVDAWQEANPQTTP